MKSQSKVSPFRRAGAAVVIVALQVQLVTAQAAMSQLPGLFTAPPDSNVFFTLDDSGSMKADAIPDMPANDSSLSFADNDSSSFVNSARGVAFPNMWGSGSSYLSLNAYRSNSAAARYLRSSAGNPLYYDRTVTYLPWPLASNDKQLRTAANPSAVNIHTDDPGNSGRTINLRNRVNVSGGSGASDDESRNFWPATYYVYTGTTPLPVATINSAQNTAGNFTKVEIKPFRTPSQPSVPSTYFRAATRTDCTGTVGAANGCTYAQELQNFANWLQYYRSRLLMAKGGVAAAFAKQSTNLRVGLGSINFSGTLRRGVSPFTGANRTAFYNELYGVDSGPTSGGGIHLTPLRKAMDDVGKYFQRANVGNPWAQDPTSNTIGTEFSCRRSFHILSTDGFWNSTGATSPANGNNDSFSGNTPSKPDGTFYTYSNTATSSTDPLVARFSRQPFSDNRSDTLADVAAYYWRTDLRSNLSNNVSPSARDPAFWQHLTTFTVGLGVNGTGTVTKTVNGVNSIADLSTQTARDLLVTNRTQVNWTTPAADAATTGDDLIHASMNGRGRYFSATNPTELANGLASALAEAADIPLDLAAVAADSPQVAAGGVLFQGTFSPQNWYGRLYAFPQDAVSGEVSTNPSSALWEASNKMPDPAARNIFTIDTTVPAAPVGKTFTWANLTATQQAALNNDPTLLEYLRGSKAREISQGGPFRDRTRNPVGAVAGGVLGDIVNGAPIKGPDAGGSYDRLSDPTEAQAYVTYRTGNTLDNMRRTIFAAANDGMLHAFNTADGVERFAYVPNSVFTVPTSTGNENRLAMLSEVTYPHRFTVDGPPNIADAFIGGAWKTLLIGTTGAGARSIFALDITDPVVGAGGFGTNKVLWEFSQANNGDMGHVLGYGHLARMRNGAWAVIFGNGYESATGQAKLFILDAATGAVIREFAVGTAGQGNGLSMPNFVLNNNREVETIYAGDIEGNLWKFDVSATTATSWNVAFGGNPLFRAGATQPITVMPEITAHPEGGLLLSFGTGRLYDTTDTEATTTTNVNQNRQAVYGIWDKPQETAGISGGVNALQERVVPSTPVNPGPSSATGEFQVVSATASENTTAIDWTTKRGWYFDLSSGGERVNVTPQQFKSALLVIANTPNTADPCALGGLARVLAIDPLTGVAPAFPTFDVNGDGQFTDGDVGNILVNRKGILTQPVLQLPAVTTPSVGSGSTVAPVAIFDRGQASGGRLGGVDLSRSFGGASTVVVSSGGGSGGAGVTETLCPSVLSAGRSDTSVLSAAFNGCRTTTPTAAGRKRISWKQLL